MSIQSSNNKDNGIFSNLIGTLGKKKKIKELEELEVEGANAIDSINKPFNIDTLPEDYILSK